MGRLKFNRLLLKDSFLLFLSLQLISTTLVFSQDDKYKKLSEMSLEELMNIEVSTPKKISQKISKVPASVIVIDRDEIETYGYSTLTEIIESVPGFYITDDKASSGKNVCVRGYWSLTTNHVIIQVNGKTHDYDGDIYMIEQIDVPVEAIERVEVVRGPMSVMYGSGAFFGAVNIITNAAYANKTPTNMVSFSGGNNNLQKAQFRVAGKNEDFNFVLNGSYKKNKGQDIAYNDIINEPGDNLLGKTIGTDALSKESEYINFSGSYKGFFTEFTYHKKDQGFFYAIPPIPGNKQSKVNNNFLYSIGYNTKLNDVFSLNSRFSIKNTISDIEFNFTQDVNEYAISREESSYYEGEFNLFISPMAKLDIAIGGFYKTISMHQEGDIPSIAYSNYYWLLKKGDRLNTYAVFSQATYSPFEKITFVAGLRLEQQLEYNLGIWQNMGFDYYKTIFYNIDGLPNPVSMEGTVNNGELNLIPRFAAVYAINDKNVFKILYGKAIKQPSVANNTDILSFNYFNSTQIPYLKAEEINTFELNYLSAFYSKLTTNISVFYNTLNNLITRNIDIVNGIWQPFASNAGEIKTMGTEFSFLYRPSPNFNINLAATYQHSTDELHHGIYPTASPPLLGYFKSSYTFKPIGKKENNTIVFSISGNYVDKMYSVWDNSPAVDSPTTDPNSADYIAVGRIGNKRTEPYFVLNTNVRINNLVVEEIFLNLRVSNLLNEHKHIPTLNNNAWQTKGMLIPGRQIVLSLGYVFK